MTETPGSTLAGTHREQNTSGGPSATGGHRTRIGGIVGSVSVLAVVVVCALPAASGGVFAGVAARDPQLDGLAERMAVSLGQALEKRGFTDLGSPPLPDPDDAPDAVLKGALDDARARYLEGEFATALQRASDAVTRFEGAGAFRAGEGWQAYADALVLRSVSQRRLGKDADADESLRRLAAAAPSAKLDPDITPQKTAERWAEVVAELWAKPRVQIEVITTPPGAAVTVDGKAVGRAPLVVRDLLPGVHFVGLSADGERRERRVTATAPSTRVEEQLGDARTAPARALRDAVAAPVAEATLADKAGPLGDDVVVGALVPDPAGALLVVARLRGGSAQVVGARLEKKGDARERAEELASALEEGRPGWLGEGPSSPQVVLTQAPPAWGAAGPSAGAGDPPAADDADGGGVWWIVAGVGVGVVVAGVATVAGVLIAAEANQRLAVTVDASKL